ncbi:MAG: tetratricopeptide repeat protein [Chitinophagaceae bacterium]|nr:tetratricopeptide repeat protein [Chitinophagaceae bacterium]
MFTYNNLGLVYRRLKKHDSALYYFNRVKEYAPLAQRPDWPTLHTKTVHQVW